MSYTCQHCDFQAYAKEGTEAKRLVLGELQVAGVRAGLENAQVAQAGQGDLFDDVPPPPEKPGAGEKQQARRAGLLMG